MKKYAVSKLLEGRLEIRSVRSNLVMYRSM